MSRTLHVIDQPGPVAESAVLRLSVDAAKHDPAMQGDQHAWLLFGGEAMRDAARAVGLRDEQFRLLPEPVGLHRLMPGALSAPRQLMSQAHRVVCWTEGAAQIATLIGCATVVRRVGHAGLTEYAQRIITQAHGTITSEQQPGRETLRERWGVKPGTTVVALIGDRFGDIDANAAMMATALTHEALHATEPDHADVRLLCHPLTRGRIEASELAGLLKLDHLCIQDSAVSMPWSVLPGCDVALVPSPADAGLSILWAQAFGVPVVMSGVEHLPRLESLRSIISTRSALPRDLADALTQWLKQQPAPMSA